MTAPRRFAPIRRGDVARFGSGLGNVFVLENLWTAELMDADGFHGADYTVSRRQM